MVSRLLLIAHAATVATRDLRFPSYDDDLVRLPTETLTRRIRAAERGPEPRTAETGDALGIVSHINPAWADLDVGLWAGVGVLELYAESPEAVVRYQGEVRGSDHSVALDHGGESVHDFTVRIRRGLTESRGDGITAIITSPFVLKAAVVSVIGGSDLTAVDAGPLDALELTNNAGHLTVRSLRPYPDWI